MKNHTHYILLLAAFLAWSCIKDDKPESGEASIDISIQTRSSDPYVNDGDGEFRELLLYIFNKADGSLEYFEHFTGLPAGTDELTKNVAVSRQTKLIYAVANHLGSKTIYMGGSASGYPITLNANTTVTELEWMIAESTDITDSDIMMVCKKEVVINSAITTVELPMERLAGRVDVHIFKGAGFASSTVKVKTVTLGNRILYTYCRYQMESMPSPPAGSSQTVTVTQNNVLSQLTSGFNPSPADAHAIIYSYQNLISIVQGTPILGSIPPYLEIVIDVNGTDYTYKGYLTDATQTDYLYCLRRNRVYQITAILEAIDNLKLNINVLPWGVESSEVGYGPKEGDYTFGVWNNDLNTRNGVIYYPKPSSNSSGTDDMTSYVFYEFTLTAPQGAVWTATLTNGLEFEFEESIPLNSGQCGVSKGIARNNPYLVKVGASKSWAGLERSTELYITVDGEELLINPLVSGVRKFEGSDTRVLIRQKRYMPPSR